MPDRWRLGVVERSLLEALAGADAYPNRPHRKCANVVGRLDTEFGISPSYGYEALCALARPWLLHLPLVDFHGNLGSPNDRPAAPRYTEARLSRAGAITLAAEQGSGPKAPIVLINGDLDRDGWAPPYSPRRIVETVSALVDEPRITDREIVDRIGLPATPTGCEIACDHMALAAGETTEMVSIARIAAEPGPRGEQIVLTNLPLGISAETIMESLHARVVAGRRHPDLRPGAEFGDLGLPLRDIVDMSHGDVTRIVCTPQPGADLDDVVQQIAATWGVCTRRNVRLPAPLPELVRDLVDDDVAAQRAALTRLLGSTSD